MEWRLFTSMRSNTRQLVRLVAVLSLLPTICASLYGDINSKVRSGPASQEQNATPVPPPADGVIDRPSTPGWLVYVFDGTYIGVSTSVSGTTILRAGTDVYRWDAGKLDRLGQGDGVINNKGDIAFSHTTFNYWTLSDQGYGSVAETWLRGASSPIMYYPPSFSFDGINYDAGNIPYHTTSQPVLVEQIDDTGHVWAIQGLVRDQWVTIAGFTAEPAPKVVPSQFFQPWINHNGNVISRVELNDGFGTEVNYLNGVELDYTPQYLADNDMIIGTRGTGSFIKSGTVETPAPTDLNGFAITTWIDSQGRFNGQRFDPLDYSISPVLFVPKKNPDGTLVSPPAYSAVDYVPLAIGGGWQTDHQVAPGTTAPQLGQAWKADGNGNLQYSAFLAFPAPVGRVWETDNPANEPAAIGWRDDPVDNKQLPDVNNNLYGTPRNVLYIPADLTDGKYHVTVQIHSGESLVCAAYRGGSKVPGTDVIVDPLGNTTLTVPAVGASLAGDDFSLMCGVDQNSNGVIDANEVTFSVLVSSGATGAAEPVLIKGFSRDAVSNARTTILGQAFGILWTGWKPNILGPLFVPTAISLERLFYTGDSSTLDAPYRPTDILPAVMINPKGPPGDFSEWLTHSAGANFDPDGALIPLYHFADGTPISDLIELASPLANLKNRTAIISAADAETHSTVDQFKTPDVPVGTVKLFPDAPEGHDLQLVLASLGKPHWSPDWVAKQTILVGDEDGELGIIPDDAFGTMGRSRFSSGRYWFVVKKESRVTTEILPSGDPFDVVRTYVVTYLRISGKSEDLYDFNHACGGLSVPAAITQISYGNGNSGRPGGMIFRSTVDIFHEYEMSETLLP